MESYCIPSISCFNPRSRMGSDFSGLRDGNTSKLFQSTLPYGERPGSETYIVANSLFQSTLPYGERQSSPGTWNHESLFQSTLPYGERQKASLSWTLIPSFNPRSRMGSDPTAQEDEVKNVCFNPRSRMGSDGCAMNFPKKIMRFQSTLPYGERPNLYQAIEKLKSFNPRSRMGSDGLTVRANNCMTCFNPRSRMGSDDFFPDSCPEVSVSIHAPVWGATFPRLPDVFCQFLFQSTLPYGERQQSRTIFLPFSVIVYAIITILLY